MREFDCDELNKIARLRAAVCTAFETFDVNDRYPVIGLSSRQVSSLRMRSLTLGASPGFAFCPYIHGRWLKSDNLSVYSARDISTGIEDISTYLKHKITQIVSNEVNKTVQIFWIYLLHTHTQHFFVLLHYICIIMRKIWEIIINIISFWNYV